MNKFNIFKTRGLVINDDEKVLNNLQRINYYRLSGYTLTLRKNNVFNKNISFDNVMEIYNFDSELRILLLYLLEYIEISFRTHIGYHHAEKYGAVGYLNSNSFKNPDYYKNFINEFNEIINDERKSNEVFIKHHKDNYGGIFPIWVATELMSFGMLSKLYTNLTDDIQEKIARSYYGINSSYIRNWLHGLTILRNICAHRGRLYNRPMTHKPSLSRYDKKTGIRNDRVFVYIFILHKLIKDKELWLDFLSRFQNIVDEHPFVRLSYLGFPTEWEELIKSE